MRSIQMNNAELKALLAKYIDHVSEMEGCDFIPKDIGYTNSYGRVTTIDPFTEEELGVLWEAARWDEKNKGWKDE